MYGPKLSAVRLHEHAPADTMGSTFKSFRTFKQAAAYCKMRAGSKVKCARYSHNGTVTLRYLVIYER